MSKATLLESRLSKVEQDNRRLKLTVGALLLVMAAVPLVGAVMPEQIPELITAREFQAVDASGTERARMNGSGIMYRDGAGTYRVGMTTSGIFYLDENGNDRVSMGDQGIMYSDENETLRAVMAANGIGYFGENGTPRAEMSGGGIGYSDENGNIVWSTGCAPNC